jgi:hypothetical protein
LPPDAEAPLAGLWSVVPLPVLDPLPVLEVSDLLSLPAESVDAEPSPPSGDGLDRLGRELDRSFLAQPEPLKWTVGGVNALRSVPSAPHAGQNRGAGAWIPWITSVRVPQLAQS